ncbi:MAG TPA: hypothetical protein VMY42_07085 [Thermoguttaceae bacterium]|nr:hypothetical protein [Thermoguttaceae bacterium]
MIDSTKEVERASRWTPQNAPATRRLMPTAKRFVRPIPKPAMNTVSTMVTA